MNIVLVGNPNTGKTSLFNHLTGAKQKVGNLPGVTIENKEGILNIEGNEINIIDLPGIYSLDPDTAEQRLTKKYISKNNPDVIINIIDSTNIERNLYLTLQLRTLGLPVIAVLNIIDEAHKKQIVIDINKLSELLKMPVVAVSTHKKTGIEDLYSLILQCKNGQMHVEPVCGACAGCDACSHSSKLYMEIDFIIANCVWHPTDNEKNDITQFIDTLVLNKYLGIPLFLFIMWGIFSLTFSGPATYLSDLIDKFLTETVSSSLEQFLHNIKAPEFLKSLFCDGVIPGVSSVLAFLPQIALLFILLSILEDSGYMTRAAFVADRLLSFTGLSGSSFIPLVMGFGCSVPAVMACRILPSKKDRIITVMVLPFVACSARFPVIAMFAGTFFEKNKGMFVFLMYLIGVIVSLIAAVILNKTMFKNEPSVFVMEMPPYRLPVMLNLLLHTWEKVKGFLIKAGTTLFAASVVIWFLSSYSFNFTRAKDMGDSIIAAVSGILAPLFAPLGFGNWQASAAIITAVGAKEMLVSTLAVLYPNGIMSGFSQASALSFVIFSLLYMPCLSTIITIKRELKSFRLTVLTIVFSFVSAYLVSLIINMITSSIWR